MRPHSSSALIGAALVGLGMTAAGPQAQTPILLKDVNQVPVLKSSSPSNARSSSNVGNIPGKAFATVLGVPNDPSLIGDTAVIQTFSLEATAFSAKTEVSNGVHITKGK